MAEQSSADHLALEEEEDRRRVSIPELPIRSQPSITPSQLVTR